MNPIIQIAAIAIDDQSFHELEVFEQKVKFPLDHAESEALSMNAYDREIWERVAVPIALARHSFDHFLRRHASIEKLSRKHKPYRIAALAGHNAAAFDLPFLRAWYEQADQFLPATFQVLDTMILARLYTELTGNQFPNYRLATICETLGTKPGTHDALADVRATVQIAKIMLDALKQ